MSQTGQPSRGDAATASFPPALFLIGAQKCATTYFATCLAKHPRVAVAEPKEPDFFTRHHDRGLSWYRACFPAVEPGTVLLDASVSYSVAPSDGRRDGPLAGVPARIHAASPAASIVYVVRDPVKRVHSAYWHAVMAGDESLPFVQAVSTDPWYLDASRYAWQLDCYRRFFPDSAILVLRMEEVVGDPLAAANRVYRHIGLDPVASLDMPSERVNASYRLRGPAAALPHGRVSRRGVRALAKGARQLLPPSVYERLKSTVTRKIPEMAPADRAAVAEMLAPDTQRFTQRYGIAFPPPGAAGARAGSEAANLPVGT
jgi:hypothetical protein